MIRRIRTLVGRYLLLHIRAPLRLLDVFFWPVMELFVWGFLTVYLRHLNADPMGRLVHMLINALVFWDVFYRAQQSMSLAFMEELWTKNVINLLMAPISIGEWVLSAAIYGLVKIAIITVTLFGLATLLYGFHLGVLGFALIPYMVGILFFGCAVGLFTTGLLIRFGHTAEALIWGIPFLIQPFSAIFYPLTVYPTWLQWVCRILPSTHIMEGMRRVIETGVFDVPAFLWSSGLNLLFMALCARFAWSMLERGRRTGGLVRMTG